MLTDLKGCELRGMEKGTAAPLAVALQQQLKGNGMAKHINSWMQGKSREGFDLVVTTEETSQFWCLGVMGNGNPK